MVAREKIPAKAPITYKLSYSNTDMTSSSNSQNFTAVGIPQDWAVTGVRIHNQTQWAGTSLSSLQVQIGTAANPTAYANGYELTSTVTSTSIQMSSAFAESTVLPHDIIIRFVSVGASINAITAGQVDVSIRVEPI